MGGSTLLTASRPGECLVNRLASRSVSRHRLGGSYGLVVCGAWPGARAGCMEPREDCGGLATWNPALPVSLPERAPWCSVGVAPVSLLLRGLGGGC